MLSANDHLFHLLGELGQSLLTGKRFVEPEKEQYNIGIAVSQMRIGRAKIFRPNSQLGLVAWKAKVAHRQLFIRKCGVQTGFKPVVVLHPFAELVTDQTNMIARLQFQIRSGSFRLSSGVSRNGLFNESFFLSRFVL